MNVSQHHRTRSIMITAMVSAQISILLIILKHQYHTITQRKFLDKKILITKMMIFNQFWNLSKKKHLLNIHIVTITIGAKTEHY